MDGGEYQIGTRTCTFGDIIAMDLFAVGFLSMAAEEPFDYEAWSKGRLAGPSQEWAYERGRQLALFALLSDGKVPRLYLDDDRINPRIEVLALRMVHEGVFL